MAITIPNESMIYDLSTITLSQQREFVERFNRTLVESQIRSTKEQWYFCIFEEAHTYFYQGSMRSTAMQYTVRALTQGRNFRISMSLVTQFSSMLDKDTMKFMVQRYFGASNEPNDVSYLKGFLNKQAQELKTLNSGEFLYFNKGKISKVSIEPYESNVRKTQIQIPEPEATQPTQYSNTSIIPFAKLLILLGFAVLTLNALRGM
jgi:DNA helicase HerA-like ATPase